MCVLQFNTYIFPAGIPDLVPHLEVFRHSLYYLYRIPLYYLTCALDENCLSSSARGKPDRHYRYARLKVQLICS